MPDNVSGVSVEVEEVDEECDDERTNNGNIQLDRYKTFLILYKLKIGIKNLATIQTAYKIV